MVTSQAKPIRRTMYQCTWWRRPRPAPMPTSEDATTWVVEIGPPSSEAPKITAAEALSLARPSIGLDPVDAASHGTDDLPSAE